jgi:predicted nucleotidyltransferase component of viral defense system
MTIDTIQHKDILIRILKDIFSNLEIGPYLGFKGGTAALLFYGLPRFSVDLDFDLLDPTKEKQVFDQCKKILESYGTLKESRDKRYSLFFLLSYLNKRHGAYNIKVEINKRNFESHYELNHYLGIPMKVMVQADMAAHKMVAMYERIGRANRDIFDVWFFLNSSWPVNRKIIEQRMHMPYSEFLKKCIEDLEKISDRNILSGIGKLLSEKQKTWAKVKLRTETLFLLQLALNSQQQAGLSPLLVTKTG